jgi:hypothetical protein
MFPYSPNITYPKSNTLKGRVEVMKRLKEYMDKDFMEVEKFSIYDNYILVYKPKVDHSGLK